MQTDVSDAESSRPARADGLRARPKEPSDEARHWKGALKGCVSSNVGNPCSRRDCDAGDSGRVARARHQEH